MATQAQIDANRLNAQKSTGPRSPDGKAAIRQNAFRHGFCSSIPLTQREEYSKVDVQQLLDDFREENQPVGINEEVLVYQMAEYFLYQRRASSLLTHETINIDFGVEKGPLIALMLRYHTTAVRGFSKALNELGKLQKERKLQAIGFVSQEVVEAPAETPAEPPAPPAEPPKSVPLAATEPVRTQIRVEPATARPVEAPQTTEAATKESEKAPDSRPYTPPKAA